MFCSEHFTLRITFWSGIAQEICLDLSGRLDFSWEVRHCLEPDLNFKIFWYTHGKVLYYLFSGRKKFETDEQLCGVYDQLDAVCAAMDGKCYVAKLNFR